MNSVVAELSELQQSSSVSCDWLEMQPLPKTLPTAPSLNRQSAEEMIPNALLPWILDTAERLQVPIESVAVLAFGALGGILGRKVGIHPKRVDDWLALPIYWTAIIARPGTKKSAVIEEALRPLEILQQEALAEFKRQQASEKAEQTVSKLKLEAAKDAIKVAIKNGSPDHEIRNLQNELEKLERENETKRSAERRFITSDATTEKIGELLNDNPNGLVLKRDELSGWLKSFDRTGREGDREFYLEGWNGTGGYRVDRIGRGTLHVEALCIHIIGAIQPGKLEAYVHEATRGGKGDDGLLQRFQLMTYSERPTVEPAYVDRKPNLEAREHAIHIYRKLHEFKTDQLGIQQSKGQILGLRFDEEAQCLFEEWFTKLERRLFWAHDMSPAFEAHLAKYRRLMPSLALLFHLVDWADGRAPVSSVSLKSAQRAAAWTDFLELHAQKVYAIANDSDAFSAVALASKIKEGKVTDGMQVRNIYRRHWSMLSDKQSVEAAIAVLESANWVKVEVHLTTGAPTKVIRLHPELIKRGNQ